MDIMKYVNSLKSLKTSQAVSFDMHCDIGYILDQDDGTNDSQEVYERTLLNSDQLNFIP